jgi:hypothetical protein
MRLLVDDAWKDPFVNRAAIEIIRSAGVQPYDDWGQVRAIYNFAHTFYFVNDPVMKETLRPTRELLQLMAGDCDDINGNVLPALLGAIGYETRLVTIAADPQSPESFSHVYCEVFVDGQWYPLDAARPDAQFGLAPSRFYRREVWSLTDDSHEEYPPDGGTLSGYGRRGFAGLNGFSSGWPSGQAVNGQQVQTAIQGAFGPGGSVEMSAPNPGSDLSPAKTFLVLFGLGVLVWALAK